jgi:RHS repeat-associated protein
MRHTIFILISSISRFDYSVNDLGQRDDVNRSGSAFTSANTETWNYNAKGEVETADHSTNNAFDRSFQFDGIGNRKKSADSLTLPATDNYSSNALNQYSAVGVVARTFDDDGSLINDGTKQFEWDAENRLIAVKQGTVTVAEYAYDYQSRRITKAVGSSVTNFVYDGWNPIAEFSGTALSKSYVWGMDLSGSMQGAGGVGGLLSVNDGLETYFSTFDGNGNVSEYVDSTGTVVAHYEYNAFGQATPSTTNTKSFTHQFSTKQLDAETGLNYYGYRYYDSANGGWLGRDPIDEHGGLNVYGFVYNDALNYVDIFGREPYPQKAHFLPLQPQTPRAGRMDCLTGKPWSGERGIPQEQIDDRPECPCEKRGGTKMPRYQAYGMSLTMCARLRMGEAPVVYAALDISAAIFVIANGAAFGSGFSGCAAGESLFLSSVTVETGIGLGIGLVATQGLKDWAAEDVCKIRICSVDAEKDRKKILGE